MNISNSQYQISDLFIMSQIEIFGLNIINVTTSETSNCILNIIDCFFNLSNSFISRISNKFLLSEFSHITIFNTIFFDNLSDFEIGGNGISMRMGLILMIVNSSFISLYKTNPGPVFIYYNEIMKN